MENRINIHLVKDAISSDSCALVEFVCTSSSGGLVLVTVESPVTALTDVSVCGLSEINLK